MEQAKSENLIVCLPTGSGKTYIAVMLIKEMSGSIRASIKDGGKRTIFLVKTGKRNLLIFFQIFILSFQFNLLNNKVIIFVLIPILPLDYITVH
jgi:hypothetical protein